MPRPDRARAERPAATRLQSAPGREDSGPRRRPVVESAAEAERARPRPRSTPPRERAPERSRRIGGKVFLSLLSAAVLIATGYYWRITDSFANGVTKADLIDTPAGEKPADGAVDILLVGMDSRVDAQGHPLSKEQLAMLNAGKEDGQLNTDTLILIRIPNDGGKAVGVSIPRDSYVDIPGYGQHKINSAYLRAKLDALKRLRKDGMTDQAQLEVESNKDGARNLITTVNKLTGVSIDHYAEVNLLGFYDITNAIGGIDVCLNKAVKDSYSGANFPAGVQTLQGAPALAFVRQRHGLPNSDFDRVRRQQVFMSGMAKKVISGDALSPGSDTLDNLQAAIAKSVVLDRNWDIMRFAQQMLKITGGNLTFDTIPTGRPDLKTPGDGDAIEINPTEVRNFVQGLLGGGAQPTTTSGAPAPGTDQQAAKPTVTVLNGTSHSGLAAEVTDTLSGQGFKTGEPGTAATRAKSVIRYAAGEDANGTAVVKALGGKIAAEPDANLGKGKVTVLIGKDFPTTGTQGQRLAGDALLDLDPGPRLAALQGGPPCVN